MNSIHSTEKLRRWLCEPLPTDVALSLQRLAAADDVQHLAVLPDVHLSGDVCVGVALATQHLLYPAAVGSDIGCGMAAIAANSSADLLNNKHHAAQLLTGLYRAVPAMRHARASMPGELSEAPLSDPHLVRLVSRDGRVQFGTLGRGNHFLEFQRDQDHRLWIMLHSGSRATGQAITTHHLAIAERLSGRKRLPFLDANQPAGTAYMADVEWAVRYAEESRLAMLHATEQLLARLFKIELDWSTLIHANHNHVHRETHFGQKWFVHRKGALPAADGQAGVIPGSMGTLSFRVTGRGCPDSLHSSSHGAGRPFSRAAAARSISAKQLAREMRGVWFNMRQAENLRDEAPSAYKDILAVMRAQRELTRIDRQLAPILSYKGA